MVAIHHPPAGKRAASRVRGLRDHAAFAEVIAAHGADLIVHGHEHRDMTEALPGPAGPVPVRGIASGTYHHNKPDRIARYRIYELGGGALGETVRVWDRGRRAFVTQSGPATGAANVRRKAPLARRPPSSPRLLRKRWNWIGRSRAGPSNSSGSRADTLGSRRCCCSSWPST